ncbi:MAG: MFS transporter [Sedimenticola sp.]
MQKGLGDYSFLPFTGLLALFWLFTMRYVPETKNRTIEDISKTWRKHPYDKDSCRKLPDDNDHQASCSKKRLGDMEYKGDHVKQIDTSDERTIGVTEGQCVQF